ncbi:MAG: PLP-dependent aminotransferase family protein [Amphritea sp.]|nr:PLP-dependent aminotransferase family protein [Amphritea sp.]
MKQPNYTELFIPFLNQETIPRPRYRALFLYLQQAIIAGQLPANSRLPATRELAQLLQLSRNTVKQVYEMLHAEGYIETRQGDGSYVSPQLDGRCLQAEGSTAPRKKGTVRLSRKSRQLEQLRSLYHHNREELLLPAMPALEEFPWTQWQRSVVQAGRQMKFYRSSSLLGDAGLREQIAAYLESSRGIRCHPDQVMICSGSQQGLQLAFSMLLDPGDEVLVEDPGFPGIDGAISNAEGVKVSVTIDQQGFRTDLLHNHPQARLAFITPSRNYPMGYTLSLERRLQLLQWADDRECCIIEDDYDSEFRFDGPPISALQGLEGEHKVIYSGTFSRVLHPAIRLAYLVIPESLVEPFCRMRSIQDGGLSALPQMALADFMARGQFSSHLRRMRKLYRRRRDYLLQQIDLKFPGILAWEPSDGGMHCVFRLSELYDDQKIARIANQQGLGLRPLSYYFDQQQPINGLVIGFAGFSEQQIDQGLERLRTILESGQKKG